MPPSQQVEIMETISNLKKALRREQEPFPTLEPIYGTSNRGNKLKRGASLVHAGTLASTYGPVPYKQKIEHAGHSRFILSRNPYRYNDYGDELSQNESDEEADVDAAEGNPYEGIRLEGALTQISCTFHIDMFATELLRPLTHPAELATHPTMSIPYLDPALAEMVKTTEEKLRQERANLWRAKDLNRQLLGDEAWMPCSVVESPDDWDLFAPSLNPAEGPATKRQKLNGNNEDTHGEINGSATHEIEERTNGVENRAEHVDLPNGDTLVEESAQTMVEPEEKEDTAEDAPPTTLEAVGENSDAIMIDVEPKPEMNGDHMSEDFNPAADQLKDFRSSPATQADGEGPVEGDEDTAADPPEQTSDPEASAENDVETDSPAPPPRRITRALAANNATTPPLSPTPTLTPSSTPSLLIVDPIFLLPSTLHTAPDPTGFETRKLLTAYIQKQEECVRGYETVLAKLIKALKMRDEVLEMCIAEGHVGEISDGEDWIDTERWGLGLGELRKGRLEEEDAIEDNVAAIGGGRKGRRRRQN